MDVLWNYFSLNLKHYQHFYEKKKFTWCEFCFIFIFLVFLNSKWLFETSKFKKIYSPIIKSKVMVVILKTKNLKIKNIKKGKNYFISYKYNRH